MAGGVRDPLDACTWHVHCAGGGSIRLDDPRAQGGSDLAWADHSQPLGWRFPDDERVVDAGRDDHMESHPTETQPKSAPPGTCHRPR